MEGTMKRKKDRNVCMTFDILRWNPSCLFKIFFTCVLPANPSLGGDSDSKQTKEQIHSVHFD